MVGPISWSPLCAGQPLPPLSPSLLCPFPHRPRCTNARMHPEKRSTRTRHVHPPRKGSSLSDGARIQRYIRSAWKRHRQKTANRNGALRSRIKSAKSNGGASWPRPSSPRSPDTRAMQKDWRSETPGCQQAPSPTVEESGIKQQSESGTGESKRSVIENIETPRTCPHQIPRSLQTSHAVIPGFAMTTQVAFTTAWGPIS